MTKVEESCCRRASGPATGAVATIALVLCCGAAAGETIGVVELFTSQGCASCPPADAALSHLAADPDIVALSFSVDYWDYLGWKDTFARPEFTIRQQLYAKARADRAVYTPQAVINGRTHLVGSDEEGIRKTIAEMEDQGQGLNVDIEAHVIGDRIVVEVPAGALPAGGHAGLWIASYRAPQRVEIGRGENHGETVVYTNVVDRWQVLGMWNGAAMKVELPIADIAGDRSAGCAIILQTKTDGRPGPILGATRVDLAIN